jgi:hypothetical protein
MLKIEITKKGNALGFTALGQTVCGSYSGRGKAWQVWIDGANALANVRRFETIADAKDYARTLIDEVRTRELAWWN